MTRPALLVSVVSVRMIAAAAALLALATVLASCGDTEEKVAPQPTATSVSPTATPPATSNPTVAAPGGGGGDLEGAVVPVVSPIPSPGPVPADWQTYSDDQAGVSFRYPASWYLDKDSHIVLSFDPATWITGRYPVGGVVVELRVTPIVPGNTLPDGSSPATLGGIEGWRIVRSYNTSDAGLVTWSHGIWVEHGGYTYSLVGAFAQSTPDDTVLLQIAATFKFAK